MLKIRPATEKDALAIVTINIMAWKTAYRGLVPDDFLDTLSVTPKRIEHFQSDILADDIYLVAKNKGIIVGYLSGGKVSQHHLPYPYEIYKLYVHPDFQHQGIGTALVNAFKEKINKSAFCVYTLDGNIRAIHFYQKNGGIRHPEFDCDQKIYGLVVHELCLAFEGGK